MYSILSVQAVSNLIGTTEIIFALFDRTPTRKCDPVSDRQSGSDRNDLNYIEFSSYYAGCLDERAGISAAGDDGDRRIPDQGHVSSRCGNSNGRGSVEESK